jgi:hypothetical protein
MPSKRSRSEPPSGSSEGENRSSVRRSSRERAAVQRYVAGPAHGDSYSFETARFHIVPPNGWHRFLWKMGCSALNTLKYNGELPPPVAPCPCWLLPSSDEMAVRIAEIQPQLAAAGWRTLTCDAALVSRLSNKQRLREHAEELGLLKHLPAHYPALQGAAYPAVLKGAEGNHGSNVHIVHSPEEALEIVPGGLDDEWLLQELIPGQVEYSVSLLVEDGKLLDNIETAYEYDRPEYVWPNVEELSRSSQGSVPPRFLAVMESFLPGFSGICNFNYKVRKTTGEICIFEINTRVGADLACDVPRPRARALFEKLASLGALQPSARPQARGAAAALP